MVTSRQDLKSFMIVLIAVAAMMVILLIIDLLDIRKDFGTYAGLVIISAVTIILARDIRVRWKSYPRYSRAIAMVIIILIIGLALAISGKWLLESVSVDGGSVAWYIDKRSDYQSVVDLGLHIGGIGAAIGLVIMASRNWITTKRNPHSSGQDV